MITYFKFKDMIDIAYHSNNDCLYLSFSDDYLQNNSPFKNSNDYPIYYTKRTTDNKNGWTMKALAELFESLPLSKFTSLIQVCSDGFFLDSTYAVISCLYTLCNGLSVPLVTESGFKLEKFTIS